MIWLSSQSPERQTVGAAREGRRRGLAAPASEQAPLREREHVAARHDNGSQNPNLDERQRRFERLVRASSALLGSHTPEGWLCARIKEAAFSVRASLTTSLG